MPANAAAPGRTTTTTTTTTGFSFRSLRGRAIVTPVGGR